MANDTTPAVPTPATLSRIARAARAGRSAGQAVRRFVGATRSALAAFDAEVDPLHLDDDAFDAVERASGLRAVLDAADRLAESLGSLADRA